MFVDIWSWQNRLDRSYKEPVSISSLSDLCLGVLVLRLLFLDGSWDWRACSEFVYFSYGSFLGGGATLSMTINLCLDIHDWNFFLFWAPPPIIPDFKEADIPLCLVWRLWCILVWCSIFVCKKCLGVEQRWSREALKSSASCFLSYIPWVDEYPGNGIGI